MPSILLLPLDVISMASVVSLQLLIYVVQHHYRGNKINRLSSGEQVEIGSTVTAPIAIANFWLRTKAKLSSM